VCACAFLRALRSVHRVLYQKTKTTYMYIHTHTHTHIHVYMYIYLYIGIYVYIYIDGALFKICVRIFCV